MLERGFEGSGSLRSFEGSLKRVWISVACSETGVRARRFRGRLLRGSALVGTDSGIGSDMLEGRLLLGLTDTGSIGMQL